MIKLDIELDERELRALVLLHLREILGDIELKEDEITIEVKSKQNYKSEWEVAAFRARVNKTEVHL